jgi:hypothetical protein
MMIFLWWWQFRSGIVSSSAPRRFLQPHSFDYTLGLILEDLSFIDTPASRERFFLPRKLQKMIYVFRGLAEDSGHGRVPVGYKEGHNLLGWHLPCFVPY